MTDQPQNPGLDYTALAEALKASNGYADHPYTNELLCDVRGWVRLETADLAQRLEVDPVAAVAALELTAAAPYLAKHTPTETEFLEPFTDRSFLAKMIYLGGRRPEPALDPPGTCVFTRRDPWDALVFFHGALRWAERFAHCPPHDRRELLRINLAQPFLAVVADREPAPEEIVVYQACSMIGLKVVSPPPEVPDHDLARWISQHLGLRTGPDRARQQQLDFRESGGTHNSVFVVRAMGGVDGYEVRGEIGQDMALIIDIGDREVTRSATAYLEHYVVQVLNEHTGLQATLTGHSLVLRWYDSNLTPDDLGQIIYSAIKDKLVLGTISVNLLFDPIRINSLRPSIFAYRDERLKQMQRRSEVEEAFVCCRSCASYSPLAFCIASVDRPPCCHRTYDELAVLAQFTRDKDQVTIHPGVCQDRARGRYMGVEKVARHFSRDIFGDINLHSIRDNPHPTTALAQCIAWYLEELDIICVISRDYTGRSPDGKTFMSLLERVAGRQIPGYVGVGEEYLTLPRFAAAEGGMSRVGWMNSSLKARLGIRAEHIATEKDCINMAGLKEHLAAWRH